MHPTTLPMMSKSLAGWTMMPLPMLPIPSSIVNNNIPIIHNNVILCCCAFKDLHLSNQRGTTSFWCAARRQVRYQDDGEDEDGDDIEEYGHNEEIAMLEFYSQSARGEALIVHALVDHKEVEVLIFKVSLSYMLKIIALRVFWSPIDLDNQSK